MNFVDPQTKMLLAGHTGLVGGAIRRSLERQGFERLILRSVEDIDLTDQSATRRLFDDERPEAVIVAAAKVGGILANWEQPYEFIAVNLGIELNVIAEAFRTGVKRLVFLGSSCIYPKLAPQPLKEEYLLTGPLEETNRPYAIAKIAGIELCRSLNREYGTDFISLMPTNLYGPGDNFDLTTSHVLPAMVRKFHEAKLGLPGHDGGPRKPNDPVLLWGTGVPAARVALRRRPRRRCRVPARERVGRRSPRRSRQRRSRRRPHHHGACPAGPARRRTPGIHRVGPFKTRRHAAQAARCQPHHRPWMEAGRGARRRYSQDL